MCTTRFRIAIIPPPCCTTCIMASKFRLKLSITAIRNGNLNEHTNTHRQTKILWHLNRKSKYIRFNALDQKRCICTYALPQISRTIAACMQPNARISTEPSVLAFQITHGMECAASKEFNSHRISSHISFSYLVFGVHTAHCIVSNVWLTKWMVNALPQICSRGVASLGTAQNRWPPAHCERDPGADTVLCDDPKYYK